VGIHRKCVHLSEGRILAVLQRKVEREGAFFSVQFLSEGRGQWKPFYNHLLLKCKAVDKTKINYVYLFQRALN